MKRREFLGAGAVTAALTMAGTASAMTGGRRDALVVFDSRFEEARRFAHVATEKHGLRAFGFTEDATALWHDQLVGALSQGTSVIGLTAGGARFCLHLMAGPGMRLVHHVTHTAAASQHVCWTGEKGTDQELRCAPAWPDQAVRIAVRQAIKTPGLKASLAVSRQYPGYRLPAAEHLESWLLAPAPAALRGPRPFADWIS